MKFEEEVGQDTHTKKRSFSIGILKRREGLRKKILF